jgi:hypothetical protein
MAARFLTALAAALLLVSPTVWAQSQPADPPGRVGRLSAIEGAVQQRAPDDNDWTQANLNYPVTSGFAIAPQDGGRAEIQVGSMALRVGSASELDVANLGDRDASLTLAQGELNVRAGRLASGERIEIVTPRGVMDILAAGQYHIDAGTTDSPTRFEVFNGRAELQRDGGNTALASGQAALINADDSQSLALASASSDPLDEWAVARDHSPARPPTNTARAAAPYVSPEMTGESDLSAYGNWNTDPQYGAVWYPSGVPADWAPYTDGHWAWVSPWGWTWIDDEPWGFAPFHYGRWAYRDDGWCWVPGEVVAAPIYAPALVVFLGSPEHRFFFDRDREGIGWFPLGPREAYVPGYRTSIDYVRNVNRTNVDVRNLNITRVNDRFVVNNGRGDAAGNFANHRFATVVPVGQFGHGAQRVRDVAVHSATATTTAASLPISRDPAATPVRTVAGSGATAQFNGGSRPRLPQARTAGVQSRQPGGIAAGATAPARSVAGHALPAIPSARGGTAAAGSNAPAATGSNAPGRLGASARTATANPGHALPPVPPAHSVAPSINRAGNGAPQGASVNSAAGSRAPAVTGSNAPSRLGAGARTATANPGHALPPVPPAHGLAPSINRAGNGAPQGAAVNNAPAGRTARGPFGTPRPTTSTAPNVTSSSAGRGLSQLPTNRQPLVKPPAPQTRIAQPPTVPTGSSAGHRGFAAPATPSFQRNPATPSRNFAPPPRSQAPAAAPARNFAPPPRPAPTPHVAAPVHAAPPAAPARPAANAAVSHAAPAPHPATNNNNKKQNQ